MAGSGRKTFTSGSVLSAADVQNYLQDQAVMVFATTSARTSAIASPSEGMVSYIQSNDQLQIYNGSNWIPQAYAQAAGTANSTTGVIAINTQTNVTVTFPANRFTVAPIVSAWSGSGRYICFPSTVAAGSATIGVRNVSDASGADEIVYWSAVQMTSGTAAG